MLPFHACRPTAVAGTAANKIEVPICSVEAADVDGRDDDDDDGDVEIRVGRG